MMTLEEMTAPATLHPDLEAYIEDMDGRGRCIRHPLVFAVPYFENMNNWYNRQLEAKQKIIDDALLVDDIPRVLAMTERAYRIPRLHDLADRIADHKVYWEMVAWVWIDSENIWQHERLIFSLLTASRPYRSFLMTSSERKKLCRKAQRFIIYRGHQSNNRNGLSWTTDPAKAKFFATRWHHDGFITKGWANRHDVLALFDGRSEAEIVIDPALVENRTTRSAV